MTRRDFVMAALTTGAGQAAGQASLVVPVRHVIDSEQTWTTAQIRHFWSRVWPEAERDFARCGIRLQSTVVAGEMGRSPSGQPQLGGLDRRAINMFLTGSIPLAWDSGRALSGVTTLYNRYHLCMIAVRQAHCHQIPFLSVNTCVHELLHALFDDILERRPKGLPGEAREFRIDWYATRLWLFHDGSVIRRAAKTCLERLSA